MSGHWPYIIAAYTICFVLFAIDWFASVIELKNLKRDSLMRQRRDAARPEVNSTKVVSDQSNNHKSMDATANE